MGEQSTAPLIRNLGFTQWSLHAPAAWPAGTRPDTHCKEAGWASGPIRTFSRRQYLLPLHSLQCEPQILQVSCSTPIFLHMYLLRCSWSKNLKLKNLVSLQKNGWSINVFSSCAAVILYKFVPIYVFIQSSFNCADELLPPCRSAMFPLSFDAPAFQKCWTCLGTPHAQLCWMRGNSGR